MLRWNTHKPGSPPSPPAWPSPPHSPPQSPPPQQRPVECGRPGLCSEAAGLRSPDELHEVCALTSTQLTYNSHHMHLLTARYTAPSQGAVLLRRQALLSMGIPSAWLLCVGSVKRGLAVRTQQELHRGRGHLPSRRRQALHRCRARGRLHARHRMSVRL